MNMIAVYLFLYCVIGWPQKVIHYQIIKKIVLNHI